MSRRGFELAPFDRKSNFLATELGRQKFFVLSRKYIWHNMFQNNMSRYARKSRQTIINTFNFKQKCNRRIIYRPNTLLDLLMITNRLSKSFGLLLTTVVKNALFSWRWESIRSRRLERQVIKVL